MKNIYDPLDYRFSELNRLEPTKGRLLISDPFLPDPYFKRSVVLLVDYNDIEKKWFKIEKKNNIEDMEEPEKP